MPRAVQFAFQTPHGEYPARRTASIVLPGERPVRMYDLPTAGRCGRVNFRAVHPEHLPVPEGLVIVCQDGSARPTNRTTGSIIRYVSILTLPLTVP